MATPVQDVLDEMATDWRPSADQARRAVRRAVVAAAREDGGLVHAATVRRHLPAGVPHRFIGATICVLVRTGYLVPTGRRRALGDGTTRNATKVAEVRRLVRVIPVEEL